MLNGNLKVIVSHIVNHLYIYYLSVCYSVYFTCCISIILHDLYFLFRKEVQALVPHGK